jgi:hypothetical protein
MKHDIEEVEIGIYGYLIISTLSCIVAYVLLGGLQ